MKPTEASPKCEHILILPEPERDLGKRDCELQDRSKRELMRLVESMEGRRRGRNLGDYRDLRKDWFEK